MARYLVKRVLNYVVLLFVAVTVVYFLAASQLNPLVRYDISDPNRDWDSIYSALADKNLSPQTPLLERYWTWLGDVIRGDWGVSPSGGSVNDAISAKVWVSVRLVTIGFVVGAAVGVLVGAWTATRQYKASDRAFTFGSLVVLSTPVPVIAVVLQISAIWINRKTGSDFFEFTGETGSHGDSWIAAFGDRLQHLLLPTICLALTQIAFFSRYQRSLMLDTLGADYVRTAQAKGLSRRAAVFKHGLRTALIPTGTLFAFQVATIFVGATFTETLFGWHGMGEYFIQSLLTQDVHGTVAVAAFSGVCVMVGAIASELFIVLLDPRVRVS